MDMVRNVQGWALIVLAFLVTSHAHEYTLPNKAQRANFTQESAPGKNQDPFDALGYRAFEPSEKLVKHELLRCQNPNAYEGLVNHEIVLHGAKMPPPHMRIEFHGSYVFVINYVPSLLRFTCNESITFTTHGGFEFLDNLVPLAERWRGPISVAVYSPGPDFSKTLRRIRFLRDCTSVLVKELVTFHLFFDIKFFRIMKIKPPTILQRLYNCSQIPPFGSQVRSTFRWAKNLTYPVNVVRNFARTQSRTHFLLAADIELYPSMNLIPMFMEMIASNEINGTVPPSDKEVYVLPAFEVAQNVSMPNSKAELLKLLKNGKAVPFHEKLCSYCHVLPGRNKWMKSNSTEVRTSVSHTVKRLGMFDWEPVYIGTNADPLFDEALSWEGQRNKMTQAFAMCLTDYNYNILNNGFLVHRPGIKKESSNRKYKVEIKKQNLRIGGIRKQLITKYGERKGCKL